MQVGIPHERRELFFHRSPEGPVSTRSSGYGVKYLEDDGIKGQGALTSKLPFPAPGATLVEGLPTVCSQMW